MRRRRPRSCTASTSRRAAEKLVALKDYLATFGIELALGQVIRPATFNRVIGLIDDEHVRPQVMEAVLRSQTQAYYAPRIQGHFGWALGSYAHFTSPIRRYSDLLVHRSLVDAYGLGDGGLTKAEAERMAELGELISRAERRAMEAERETVDRYVAAYSFRPRLARYWKPGSRACSLSVFSRR